MTYAEALAYLEERVRWGMRPGTERMVALMAALGDPQRSYPVLHVAGTNGKYSVALMASRLLTALGFTTGLYTSPHIEDLRERIAFDGEPIDGDSFAEVLGHLQPYLQAVEAERDDHLTYFETLTATAFEAFFDRAVHAAVVEAGLGGEYDATNVVEARVGVVTRVAMDHVVEFEGSLERAAWEKAGIAKPGATVVCGVDDPHLVAIVEQRAAEREAAEFLLLGRDLSAEATLAVGGLMTTLRTPRATYRDVFLPLHGAHQASNAVLALAAVEAFVDAPVDADTVRDALWEVQIPGRLEVAGRQPLLLLDGGHNPDAAAAVVSTVREAFVYERATCVVAMLDDKLVEEVLDLLAPAFDRFLVTAVRDGRAAPVDRLAAALTAAGAGDRVDVVTGGVPEAVRRAIDEAGAEDLVCVFGSFYTVGEARAWLRAEGLLPQA